MPLPGPEDAGADPELLFLVRSADRLEVPVELLDLGESGHSGVHVLLARSAQRWAVGSDPDRRTAAVTALRDLLGAVQYGQDEASGAPADTGDPLLRDLDARTLTVTGAGEPPVSGPAVGWAEVQGRLAAAGREAYVVPTGSPTWRRRASTRSGCS